MHLAALRDRNWRGRDFHCCDDIDQRPRRRPLRRRTAHALARAAARGGQRALIARWTPEERARALAALKAFVDRLSAGPCERRCRLPRRHLRHASLRNRPSRRPRDAVRRRCCSGFRRAGRRASPPAQFRTLRIVRSTPPISARITPTSGNMTRPASPAKSCAERTARLAALPRRLPGLRRDQISARAARAPRRLDDPPAHGPRGSDRPSKRFIAINARFIDAMRLRPRRRGWVRAAREPICPKT